MNWISIKDRLPGPDTNVLVCGFKWNDPSAGYWQRVLCWRDDGCWTLDDETQKRWDGYPVTHWMPLPEAP